MFANHFLFLFCFIFLSFPNLNLPGLLLLPYFSDSVKCVKKMDLALNLLLHNLN